MSIFFNINKPGRLGGLGSEGVCPKGALFPVTFSGNLQTNRQSRTANLFSLLAKNEPSCLSWINPSAFVMV